MQRVNRLSRIFDLTVNMQFSICFSLIVLSLSFVSCQKEKQLIKSSSSVASPDFKGSINLNNIVIKEKVSKWLKQQSELNIESRKKITELAIHNLENADLTYEAISKQRTLAILPIIHGRDFFNRDSVTVIENFIFFIDSLGLIQDGYLSKYFPDDQSITELPQNGLSDIFNHQAISIDGTFEVTNFDEVKQYEFDFFEGKKQEFRLWESRLALPPGGIGNGEICIDWYLTTTIFNGNGEIIDYFETYLFTNCSSPGPGSNNVPPPPLAAIPSFKDVEMLVVNDVYSNGSKNEVIAFYKLSGWKILGDTRQNVFSSARPVGSMLFQYGVAGISSNGNFMAWTENSNNITFGNYSAAAYMPGPTTATAICSGVKTYPNQGVSRDVVKSATWHASSIL
ncbi:MAG TPA: hypothetical protein PK977_05910 [Chitinophagaceae bacterium]|nr:hypothetical protein [Chitinophagaceae bacterium]